MRQIGESPLKRCSASERAKLQGLEPLSTATVLSSEFTVPVKVVWGGRVHESCEARLIKKGNYRRVHIFLPDYKNTPWISIDPEYYFKQTSVLIFQQVRNRVAAAVL